MKTEAREVVDYSGITKLLTAASSWTLGSVVGAGVVALLMLFFPHAIPSTLGPAWNLALGGTIGLAFHRVVERLVEILTPRKSREAIAGVEKIASLQATLPLLSDIEKSEAAEQVSQGTIEALAEPEVIPRRSPKRRASGKRRQKQDPGQA